eukprot:9611947-Lingulodinium_polyedra.AAC.1
MSARWPLRQRPASQQRHRRKTTCAWMRWGGPRGDISHGTGSPAGLPWGGHGSPEACAWWGR